MANFFRDLFKRAIHTEQQILRPYFFADEFARPERLETEETYFRLRLTRMFLKNQRDWFKTKYPIVHTSMSFVGIDGTVEMQFVARPELSADNDLANLAQITPLEQTLLGPVLYRGGDLDLLLGLYAATATDWSQRFLDLAAGITQFAIPAPLTTAISVAGTIKKAIENTLGGDDVTLKLGLDKELKENDWLAPGWLVMIAAPDDEIDLPNLAVEDGELLTQQGEIYRAHDYIVLAIEVTDMRSDWQSLGYGTLWQELKKTAANANDIAQVKEAYLTFSGAVLASADLSITDRRRIVALAQQQVKEIRQARSTGFLEGIKGVRGADDPMEDEEALYDVEVEALTVEGLLSADFLD